MICVWSLSSVIVFWRKIKQYDQSKIILDSIQRATAPFDFNRPTEDILGETSTRRTNLPGSLDVSSTNDFDDYSGEFANLTASLNLADPTIKLRRKSKSKVDYGRDRDLDVEGVNDYLLWYENFQNNIPRLPTLARQQKCTKPIQNVAFIKTHHTGSDVITNILNRYGDLNYLNIALPSDNLPTFFWPMRFQWKYIDITMLNGSLPNIICNHARYNNDVMDNILNPGSVYLTILRDPITQLETTFNNMDFGDLLQVTNTTDQLLTFLKFPKHYIQGVIRRKHFKDTLNLIKNAQFFDLGLSTTEYHRKNVIKMTIQELYEKFSIVLIYEYLDESLVLMKRRLCWQLDDILYLKFQYTDQNQKNRNNFTGELIEKIKIWNQADIYLYDFFNRTLWKEIEYEGDHFWNEVKEFKLSQKRMENTCVRKEGDVSFPGDDKFALFDIPTTPRASSISKRSKNRHASSTQQIVSSKQTTTIMQQESTMEASGDNSDLVEKDYKKQSNRTLRDVLSYSKAIRESKILSKRIQASKKQITLGTSLPFDNNNNNVTAKLQKGNKNKVHKGKIKSKSKQVGGLYTENNSDLFGSGTGKSITKVITNVQRMLSRTATPWDSYFCKKLLMTEVEYLDYFRKKHIYGKHAQRK